MALQAGMGVSRLLLFIGAGYTGTVLVKNGKLADIIGELQALVKNWENSGDSANSDTDQMAAQVRYAGWHKRFEFNLIAQITVVNGGSCGIDGTSLILPAATLGALGYGYMWWKGLSFSDLMYVTKRNMATAVANLTANLDNITDRLAKVKLHLTQRIENLDGKVDEQREISKHIKDQVFKTRGDIDKVTRQLYSLQETVANLDDKMGLVDEKQTLTLMGVDYLVNFIDGKTSKVPGLSQHIQEQLKLNKMRVQLPSSNAIGLQGLKAIADSANETRSIKGAE